MGLIHSPDGDKTGLWQDVGGGMWWELKKKVEGGSQRRKELSPLLFLLRLL